MAERVIWERTIDHDKIRNRHDRFRRTFFPAAGVLALAALIFAGWKNTIGVLFVLGIVGMAWGATVRFKGLSDGANPVMVVDRGRLVLGTADVILEDIKQFTTLATSIQTSMFGKYSRLQLGKAMFRLDVPGTRRDPKIVEFGWPSMDEAGVETVRQALEAELPGKWVKPTELIAEDELPRRSRRHRLG